VTTGFLLGQTSSSPDPEGSLSACWRYAEIIALELERGRNATGIWQDLVDSHGFAGGSSPEARVIIQTAPGESARSIMAPGRWCVIPTVASIGARGYLF
jgi:hypothetical protein